jgi:IMP dehydrogenase
MPTVADLIRKKQGSVAIVSAEDSVFQAVTIMAQRRIGSVVVQKGPQVVGIFTERDVLNRVVAHQLDTQKTQVHEVMSAPVVICQPVTKVAECKSIMTEKKLRHLPVVDGGQLVGMISVGDILAHEAAEQAHTIRYLHEYLHGRM